MTFVTHTTASAGSITQSGNIYYHYIGAVIDDRGTCNLGKLSLDHTYDKSQLMYNSRQEYTQLQSFRDDLRNHIHCLLLRQLSMNKNNSTKQFKIFHTRNCPSKLNAVDKSHMFACYFHLAQFTYIKQQH